MQIKSVTAHAFGPFEGQTLQFAPGLNVVVGRNESGKSSWHAAVYAALTGRKRARGRQSVGDAQFRDLHRPWDGKAWAVSALLDLDDGQLIEIRQDLDDKVDSRAIDRVLGRDVSAEIMFEGSPDASRWLGLNRRSFAATACISQAQLLSVLQEADGLQVHLQQAAATGGTDATAAAALDALRAYLRDNIGTERSTSTKPLRRAMVGLEHATTELAVARSAHEAFRRLADDADRAHSEAQGLEQEVLEAEARLEVVSKTVELARSAAGAEETARRVGEKRSQAAETLDTLKRRLAHAADLLEVLGGEQPAPPPNLDEQVAAVATAVSGWTAAPAVLSLNGRSSAEIAEEMNGLPDAPDGDTAIHPSVATAAEQYQRASAVHENVAAAQPSEPHPEPDLQGAFTTGAGAVRSLAAQLDAAPAPAPASEDASLRERLDTAQRELEDASRAEQGARAEYERLLQDQRRALEERDALRARSAAETRPARAAGPFAALLAGSLLFAVVGVVGFVLAAPVLGAVGLVAGLAAALGALALRPRLAVVPLQDELTAAEQAARSVSERVEAASRAVRAAEAGVTAAERERVLRTAELLQHEEAVESVRRRRAEIVQRIEEARLPVDSAALRSIASRVDDVLALSKTREEWETRIGKAATDVAGARETLVNALTARGADPDGAPLEAIARYRAACLARAEQAQLAGRRSELSREHERRTADERRAQEAAEKVRLAVAELRAAGARVGLGDTEKLEPQQLVEELERWLDRSQAAGEEAARRQRQWGELQSLLGGGSLRDLRSQVDAAAQLAQEIAQEWEAAEQARECAQHLLLAAAEAAALASAELDRLEAVESAAKEQVTSSRSAYVLAVSRAKESAGARAERSRGLVSVAEAEERLAGAQAELDRLRGLEQALDTTAAFLEAAQDRVHRDIAPELARTLGEWLPGITDGRYVDATVDPATLQVQVCGPDRQFRRAEFLSHGTAEQVYLLLRAALTEHLTAGHDTCPLLLDDPTVQADSVRLVKILDLLHALSQERQIVLFAQQAEVAEWARENLTGADDRVIELEQVLTV